MTSKTGSTDMTLKGTRDPPPFAAALAGAVGQLGTLYYVWANYTSAKGCLKTDPLGCLTHPLSADPWGRQVLFVVVGALIVWLVSLTALIKGSPHSDPSIVDRLWSLQPWLYCWHLYWSARHANAGAHANDRLLLMAVLSTVWGVRLTINFAVKGGFSGGEDYRWKEVQSWWSGWQFEVFNLLFVCLFQQLEILAFSVPAVAALQSNTPLGTLDYIAAGLYTVLVLGEAIADYQMFNFQTAKYARKNAGKPLGEYSRGFIESGLWRFSRHPNYFCEVSLWWAFYLFSVSATGEWLNWTIWGAIFLTGLFVPPGASLDLTEMLSSRKYPAYEEYQRTTSRFVPWFPSSKAKAK